MPDNGNCPPGFPVRLPNLFFEAFYSVSDFPHGQGTQPFVLSPGDPTGYGFHGDFLNGWDPKIMQAAILDPSCDAVSTNNGNTVKNCIPLAPYVYGPGQEPDPGQCPLAKTIPLTEDLGVNHPIARLPGCNPITYVSSPLCEASPQQSYASPVTERFALLSKFTGQYFTCPQALATLPTVTVNASELTYSETFTAVDYPGGVGIFGEWSLQYFSAHGNNGALMCDRGAVGSWETFKFVPQSGGYVSIVSLKNNNYLSVQSDFSLAPTATTVTDKELFQQVVPNGGRACLTC
jgi:hypothetical protein